MKREVEIGESLAGKRVTLPDGRRGQVIAERDGLVHVRPDSDRFVLVQTRPCDLRDDSGRA